MNRINFPKELDHLLAKVESLPMSLRTDNLVGSMIQSAWNLAIETAASKSFSVFGSEKENLVVSKESILNLKIKE